MHISINYPRKKVIKSRIPISWLYFIALGIFLSISILRQSFYVKYLPEPVYKLILVGCVGLIMIKEFFSDEFTEREIVGAVVCLCTALILYHRTFKAIPLFIFIYFGRNIDFKRIAKFSVAVTGLSLFFVIVSAYTSVIPNYVEYAWTNAAGRERHYLGFTYALFPSSILFNTVALYLYTHKENTRSIHCLLALVSSFFIFSKTDSRLNFVLSVLMILSFYAMPMIERIMNVVKIVPFLMSISWLACAVFSLSLAWRYDATTKWMRTADRIFGNRLRLSHEALIKYPIKLFGSQITFVGNGLSTDGKPIVGIYNYVDCFYENIMLRYGLVFLIIVVLLFTLCGIKAWKKKNYHFLIIMLLLAIHGMIDDSILGLHCNTFWLMIGSYLFSNHDFDARDFVTKIMKRLSNGRHTLFIR